MNPDRAAFGLSVDQDPAETRRKVLEVLAASPAPLRRRAIQQLVWKTDLFGAGQTIHALRYLVEIGWVESGYNPQSTRGTGTYRITDAGRAELEAAQTVMGEAS